MLIEPDLHRVQIVWSTMLRCDKETLRVGEVACDARSSEARLTPAMAERTVVVIGVGMKTAVGLTAVETAASVRAGTMRFTESSIHDHRFEPFTLAEVPEDGLPVHEDLAGTAGLTSRELVCCVSRPRRCPSVLSRSGRRTEARIDAVAPGDGDDDAAGRPAFLKRLAKRRPTGSILRAARPRFSGGRVD